MKRILFLCTHNSGRSQIAEAIVNRFHCDKFEARSAGTEPGTPNILVISALEELGFDTSGMHSKHLDIFLDEKWDYVITLCDSANEGCPFFPGGKERIHHSFSDPSAFVGTEYEKRKQVMTLVEDIKKWFEQDFLGK
ncbi:MAG TPA: arsenate reductase ArsC [Euryarchaeota archaeon]|nr:arsenate reductase ArsC [Euryarchaeota archaeon]